MSITVLCPSRGRPAKLREAADSLIRTRKRGDTRLLAVIDADEPEMNAYLAETALYSWMVVEHAGGMVNALNAAVGQLLAEERETTILGFIGDDHRFRTDGWDLEVAQALRNGGFAYGNDLYMGEYLPTHVFISRDIVEVLGYMALPGLHHLYVDNAWKDLGTEAGVLHYLPNVIVEHVHPMAQKAEWDEGYRRVNSDAMYAQDGSVFKLWRQSKRFFEDVNRVRRAVA